MDTKSPSGTPPQGVWPPLQCCRRRRLHSFPPKMHQAPPPPMSVAAGSGEARSLCAGLCLQSQLRGALRQENHLSPVLGCSALCWSCVCTKFGISMVTSWEWGTTKLPKEAWNGAAQSSCAEEEYWLHSTWSTAECKCEDFRLKPSRQIQFLMEKR